MPAKRLNDRFIKSVKPPKSGRTEYWDTLVKGLALRVTDRGHKSWTVMYRHGRRLRRVTLRSGLPLADARAEARKMLRDAALGADPATNRLAERQAESFGDLAELYIERHAKANKRSWREDRRALDRDVLPAIGSRKARDIRRRDVISVLDEIKDRGAPVLANRTLEIMRRIFNWGIETEFIESNPCLAIRPNPEASRDRVLGDAEIRSLWIALDGAPALAGARFKLQFLTAQRPGEVRQMRWADTDPRGSWWTIPAGLSKNRLAHRVPLIPAAVEILAGVEDITRDDEWVFPSPAGGPIRSNTKSWEKIRKAARIDATPHDLRRTVASHMAAMGVGRLTIARLLNHVETGVTAVYDRHSYDREKREALAAWAHRLGEILTEK